MSTVTRPAKVGQRLYRLNTDQYDAMIRAGVFPEGARLELLGGLLFSKMTKFPPHVTSVGQSQDALRTVLIPGWFINVEQPVELDRRWRPEPDLSIIRGRRPDYSAKLPEQDDLAFLIEVADTSYPIDRGKKWRGYASAGVGIYWIINLNSRQVEVYTDPAGKGSKAVYRSEKLYAADAEVPVFIVGREVGRIPVKDLLP